MATMTQMLTVVGECFDGAPSFTISGCNQEMTALFKLACDRPLLLVDVGDNTFFLQANKRHRLK